MTERSLEPSSSASAVSPERDDPRDPPEHTPSRRPPLSRRARRLVLLLHVISSGAWFGVDVVLAILVGTVLLTSDPYDAGIALRATGLFAVYALTGAGLLSLATGVVLGLGTQWGLLRYAWVTTKLVLSIVLVVLIPILLRGAVADAALHGQALLDRATTEVDVGGMVFPPAVSGSVLLFAFVLSVFKPWGRRKGTR